MVSVIIPIYNAEKWLRKTLNSVLAQDYLLEIICVDDHSTDKSLEIVKEFANSYPKIIKVFKNPGKGSNSARRFGFIQSKGKFIQWLDADDQLLPGKFKAQVDFLLSNKKCDIVYSDWQMDFYDSKNKLIKSEFIKRTNYQDYLLTLLKNIWSPPNTYLMRRSIVENLHKQGYWNIKTVIAQDREYFTMAALFDAKFCYVQGLYSIYNRWSNKQISAMDFKKRLAYQMELEKKFHDFIKQKKYPKKVERKYLACLNAHVINANFYNPRLGMPFLFSIFNVDWSIVHWKKQLVAPFIYFLSLLKYFFKKFRLF